MVRRAAFTFIELIFAIVIIAISVVSLPMMNQSIFKGIEESVVQEAIFAAATELNEITSAYWDDNSLDVGATNSLARVIDHEGNCKNDSSLEDYRRMPGHIVQPLHRRCLDSDATIPDNNDNSDDTVLSVGDKAHGSSTIFTNTVTDDTGYKQEYNSTVTVTLGATFDGVTYQDIKEITVSITDSDDEVITSLTTYSANIGEIDYYKREY